VLRCIICSVLLGLWVPLPLSWGLLSKCDSPCSWSGFSGFFEPTRPARDGARFDSLRPAGSTSFDGFTVHGSRNLATHGNPAPGEEMSIASCLCSSISRLRMSINPISRSWCMPSGSVMATSRGRILLPELQDRKSQVHRVKVTNIMNKTSGVAWGINFWWMATAATAARNGSKELRSIGERAEREIRRCSPRRKKE